MVMGLIVARRIAATKNCVAGTTTRRIFSFAGRSSMNHSLRFLSASSSPSQQSIRPRSGSPNRGGIRYTDQKQSLEQRTVRLQSESESFLKRRARFDSARQTRELQNLLLECGKLIPLLFKAHKKELMVRATGIADSLAHALLDCPTPSKMSTSISSQRHAVTVISLVTAAIHGWAKVQSVIPNHTDAAANAERILMRLPSFPTRDDDDRTTSERLLQAHRGVLDAWSKSRRAEAPDKALRLLRKMKEFRGTRAATDLISHNCVLNAFANRGDVLAAQRFFDEMKADSILTTQYSYSTFMKAWKNSNHSDAVAQIQALLQELLQQYSPSRRPDLLPSSHVFSIAIRMAPSADKAEQLLDDMLQWYERTGRSASLRPTSGIFVMCMTRMVELGCPANKVEAIFHRMQSLYEQGYHQLRPNHQCFVVVLSAWAKQGTPDSISHAERILKKMEELFLKPGRPNDPRERMNAYGYNIVMGAIAKSGDDTSVQRVERIMDRMTALAKKYDNPALHPDKISYSGLMKGLMRQNAPGVAHRVNELLEDMKQSYNDTGRESVKPDIVCYACTMDAWAKSGAPEAAERVEALIDETSELSKLPGQRDLHPNSVCFNTLIDIYANKGKVAEATNVLNLMEEKFDKGIKIARPDAVSFTSCIDAWAASADRDRMKPAMTLFDRMLKRYESGQAHCKPSTRTFCSLMYTLAKSGEPEKTRLAQAILATFEQIGISHSVRSYDALIYAYTSQRGDDDAKHHALKLAIAVFHKMREEGIGTDSVTYNSLLHACSRLVSDPEEQQAAIGDVFRKCCEDGKVNDIVMRTLYQLASRDLRRNLLGDEGDNICIDDLPKDWTLHSIPSQ